MTIMRSCFESCSKQQFVTIQVQVQVKSQQSKKAHSTMQIYNWETAEICLESLLKIDVLVIVWYSKNDLPAYCQWWSGSHPGLESQQWPPPASLHPGPTPVIIKKSYSTSGQQILIVTIQVQSPSLMSKSKLNSKL